MITETQVICSHNLNFRLIGKARAKLLFVATKGTLIKQLTEPNVDGYALGRIDTYRKGDEMWTVADSLSRSLTVEAKLGRDAVFVADKPVDEFGRTPGHVEGWFFVALTTPVEGVG